MRRKDVVDEKKDQKKVKSRKSGKSEAALGICGALRPAAESDSGSVLVTGRPASQYLTPEGEYTGGELAAMPYIDPMSEGFDKLPAEVQTHSLRIWAADLKAENDFLKKRRGSGGV